MNLIGGEWSHVCVLPAKVGGSEFSGSYMEEVGPTEGKILQTQRYFKMLGSQQT